MNSTQFSATRILGLVLSVIFIWVFLFSVWYSNNILNQEKFVATTTQVLNSETVRNAISNQIIQVVKVKRPIIGSITEPILTKVIAGVMDSNLYSAINTKLAQEMHLQLTSANPRELTIELKPMKDFLSPFIEKTDSELLKSVPDNIVVIRKNQIPSLYKFGTTLTMLGPILLIAALIILVVLWRKITDKRNYIVILSLCFAASGLLVYFLVPTLGNYISAQADSVNTAAIINEVYYAFTAPISQFAMNLLVGSLIIAVLAKFLKRDLFKLPQKNPTPRAK
jgi:hypothetical protein